MMEIESALPTIEWTTDKPTAPGLYWVIDPCAGGVDASDADIVRIVTERGGILYVREIGRDFEFRLRLDAEYSHNTLWYGPIEAPKVEPPK
jgi:hypothetical protein